MNLQATRQNVRLLMHLAAAFILACNEEIPSSNSSSLSDGLNSISGCDSSGSSGIRNPHCNSGLNVTLVQADFHVSGKPNIVIDSKGNVFYPDTNQSLIWKVEPNGIQSIFAGSGSTVSPLPMVDGVGTAANFSRPYLLAIDRGDNLYVLDYGSAYIRKISPTAVVTTTQASVNGIKCLGFAVDTEGSFFCSRTVPSTWDAAHKISKILPNGTMFDFAGDGTIGFVDGNGISARLNYPMDLGIDGNDNLYVSDMLNYAVRKISKTGDVSTLAGNGIQGLRDGIGRDALLNFDTWAYSHKGGLGTLFVTQAGTVYIADMTFSTGYIRKIDSSGTVTTICGNGSDIINASTSCAKTGLWVNAGLAIAQHGEIYFGAGSRLYKISR